MPDPSGRPGRGPAPRAGAASTAASRGLALAAALAAARAPAAAWLSPSCPPGAAAAAAPLPRCRRAAAVPRRALPRVALPRRPAALGLALGGVGGVRLARAGQPGPMKLRKVIAETGLEEYRLDEYEAMRDDGPRTSKYEAAIKRRLKGQEGKAVVVDIGTGPFALLAVIAARAGARRVYAIEKTPAVAALAREAVKLEGLQDKITIVEGNALEVSIPERADFIVSELIGSIAKQEGVQRIIEDANKRFLKKAPRGAGLSCPQQIPARCQTFIAPVSFRYHPFLNAKPEWTPLRLDSMSKDLGFLAQEQMLEDFDYCDPAGSGREESRKMTFKVSEEAWRGAGGVFSGVAMWCKVQMDEVDVIEVKGVRSHWAYVVALMAEQPVPLRAPSDIRLESRIDFGADPVRYEFEAEILPA